MNRHFASTGPIAAAAVVAVLLMLANPATAAESTAKTPPRRVVLRVSYSMLNSLLGNNDVNRQVDIRDTILGTSVSGMLRLVGKSSFTLVDSPERAVFIVHFNGTTYSRTTGYNGPAIIYSRTVTTFSASKQIVLEPGKGFYGLPPQVTAHTQVILEGIDSTRGGLVGRIVCRRATKIEAARHDEATEIARQKTEKRIEARFEHYTEQRLAQLNSLASFSALAMTSPGTTNKNERKFSFSTTAHCLQIAANFGGGTSAEDLPHFDEDSLAVAPVELWIHNSLVSDTVAAGLGRLDSHIGIGMLIQTVAQLVLPESQVEALKLGALLAGQQIRIRKAADWQVIAFEKPTDRSRTIAPTTEVAVRKAVLPSIAAGQPAPTSAAETAKSAQARARIWTSGVYTAHAEFVALEGKIVRLLRVNGTYTSIPLEKLSAIDQQWIANHLASR